MEKFKACPCGKIPTELEIYSEDPSDKWAYVSGDCCDQWVINFRKNYLFLDSSECIELAGEAWNTAKRVEQDLEEIEELIVYYGDLQFQMGAMDIKVREKEYREKKKESEKIKDKILSKLERGKE